MNMMQLAVQLLMNYFGDKVDEDSASNAISRLMGDGQGGIDIQDIIGQMSESGSLSSIAQSWLGDGANQGIGTQQLLEVFGSDKLSQFAQQLGVDTEEGIKGLSDILPQLIDKASSGGNLLESVGGIGGAFNMAKGLFGR
jgi:uncharacterized protein YidB (DUF937 family)